MYQRTAQWQAQLCAGGVWCYDSFSFFKKKKVIWHDLKFIKIQWDLLQSLVSSCDPHDIGFNRKSQTSNEPWTIHLAWGEAVSTVTEVQT